MTQDRFKELWFTFAKETAHLSFTKRNHPIFQELLTEPSIVPFMLEELVAGNGHWPMFELLCHHTGAVPWKPEDRGRFDPICASWIAWGKEQGLIYNLGM